MAVLSVMLGILAIVPGLPMLPFLVLAAVSGAVAYRLNQKGVRPSSPGEGALADTKDAKTGATASPASQSAGEKLETLLNIDVLQIELGYGLVPLADSKRGGDLLERVTGVRRNFAQEMGMIIPPIRLRDNLQMASNEYRFLLKGEPIARGSLMPNYWLAMNATNSKTTLKGVPTVEPVFQLPATWVTEVERKNAESNGYTVVDAASVLATHLLESIKRHAHEILARQDVQGLLDNLKQTHPTVVNELIPAQLTVGHVQRILQNLLAEGISIRNLAAILEKVSDYAAITKNPDELSEHARRALNTQLVKPFQPESGPVRAITLDPKLEQQIAQGVRQSPTETSLFLEPKLARHILDCLSKHMQQFLSAGHPPLVLCAPQIRLGFRRFFESTFSDLAVLSYADLPARVEVQSAAVISGLE
jgi:flagellar biosynthesis protein FlhA